jgi:hypothetical protein
MRHADDPIRCSLGIPFRPLQHRPRQTAPLGRTTWRCALATRTHRIELATCTHTSSDLRVQVARQTLADLLAVETAFLCLLSQCNWKLSTHITGITTILAYTYYTLCRTPWVGNLTEEKSLCVEWDLPYGDFGSHRVLKINIWQLFNDGATIGVTRW